MFGYIYLVRNKINGKQYIGQKHSSEFDPTYYGSGVYLKKALNKYGVENFEHVEILQWCEDKLSLDEAERFWINKYNAVDDPNFYNLAKGGVGTTAGSKRSDQWKSKMAEITSKRIWKDSSRKKISDHISGRLWVTDGHNSKQVLESEVEIYLNQGWYLGRPSFSKESRQRMSDSHKGKSRSEEVRKSQSERSKGLNNPFYGKTHTKEQKLKWRALRREMVWVNREGKNTVIHYSQLEDYLSQGWSRGIIRKKRSSTTIESITTEKSCSE